MAKRTPTPDQQALLEALDRYRELRRKHVRRTQLIGGRLFVGNLAALGLWIVVLGAPLALVLGWFGLGVRVEAAAVQAAGLLLIGFVVLAVFHGLEERRIARAGESGQTPVKDILGGLALGFFGVLLIVNRDTAEIVGTLALGYCLIAVLKGVFRLVRAGLRWLFRKRTGPEELEPIQSGERPAA